jgi:hypothetical protein
MDLFTPIVEEEVQHPNFRTILKYPNEFNCDVLNEWMLGFKDRDGKFVKEFQTTFDSSFWELYLFAVLKHFQLTVDFSFPAPDFVVTDHGGMNIEATVASHAQRSSPEHEKAGAPIPADLNEFNRQVILRIRNSIDAKHRKFTGSYSALDHVKGRPFILAVTAFDNPYAMLACQRAVEAVLYGYYVDEESFLREGGQLRGQHLRTVKKDSGRPVPLAIFGNKDFEWLSVVMFSSCATWGKVRALSSDPNPNIVFRTVKRNMTGVMAHASAARKAEYNESLLDGLRIYHNPSARYQLDKSIFRHKDVFQSYYREQNQDWVYEDRDGLLLFRTVQTILRKGARHVEAKKEI